MITEREAWLHIASLWDNPHVVGTAYISENMDWGICGCLDTLYYSRRISLEVLHEMKARLPSQRDRWGYCWKSNEQGAAARASFCREQATLLEEPKP